MPGAHVPSFDNQHRVSLGKAPEKYNVGREKIVMSSSYANDLQDGQNIHI